MHVYELHYLEQLPPSLTASWENVGSLKKDGISTVTDMRRNHSLLFYNDKK